MTLTRERERERESEFVCVCVCVCDFHHSWIQCQGVCVWMSSCVCVCACEPWCSYIAAHTTYIRWVTFIHVSCMFVLNVHTCRKQIIYYIHVWKTNSCINMYVYMSFIRIYICIFIYMHVYLHIYVYTYTDIHVYTYFKVHMSNLHTCGKQIHA